MDSSGPIPAEGSYMCTFCKVAFFRSSGLLSHMKDYCHKRNQLPRSWTETCETLLKSTLVAEESYSNRTSTDDSKISESKGINAESESPPEAATEAKILSPRPVNESSAVTDEKLVVGVQKIPTNETSSTGATKRKRLTEDEPLMPDEAASLQGNNVASAFELPSKKVALGEYPAASLQENDTAAALELFSNEFFEARATSSFYERLLNSTAEAPILRKHTNPFLFPRLEFEKNLEIRENYVEVEFK